MTTIRTLERVDRAEVQLFLRHLGLRAGDLLDRLEDDVVEDLTVEQWIGRLRPQHFRASELLYATDRPGNSVPPRELWGNIVPTIVLLDELRAELGRPIRITSSYRAPAYNRRVGGTRLSQHQAWGAIDFGVSGMAPAEVGEVLRGWRGRLLRLPVDRPRHRYEAPGAGPVPYEPLPTWRGDGDRPVVVEWHGGVGVYDTFVHLDSRGLDHSWSG